MGLPSSSEENADVAYHFIADRFKAHRTDSIKRLNPGTGKVVEVDGQKIAAYKDPEGNIYALNPTCTHAALHSRLERCGVRLGLPLSWCPFWAWKARY